MSVFDLHRGQRLLAVGAHPDDIELLCAGTLARAQRDGVRVWLCVICNGDKGQPKEPVADLGAVRHREMQAAARVLGAPLIWLNVPDGELFEDMRTRRLLIEAFRQSRPDVVICHDPNDYHPDHQAASRLCQAASWFAPSPSHKTASPPMARSPRVFFMDTVIGLGFEPQLYVDVTATFPVKEKMMRCHVSQLGRGKQAGFTDIMELMRDQSRFR
ncbi:MAG: PIG-L family deacetylase, partial [Verrucomicrobiae bacterium]|nr:PIG-L family deacetylase [Verrucomicrobiae bacterium]